MKKEEQWLLQEKYNGEKSEAFFADCTRLETGKPLAYLIGHAPFLDCTIYLDSKPLIPRPETEFWTEKAITQVRDRVSNLQNRETPTQKALSSRSDLAPTQTVRVLDLCAGSGCIGVAVAKAVPDARVDFAEIEAAHQTTIIKNLKQNLPQNLSVNRKVLGTEENPPVCISVNRNTDQDVYDDSDVDDVQNLYGLWQSDLFSAITPQKQYAYILSNPPYIDPAVDRAELSVKNFEPHQALYGGIAGLEIIEMIIKQSPQYLVTGGELWLEHEPEQSEAITSLATKYGFVVTTHTDQFDNERYSVLVLQ